jgi:hypothetical protein
MIFPKRQERINPPSLSAITLGQTVRVPISREFPVEMMAIRVSVTVSGVMATANADAILNILKRVVFRVSDGSDTRNVVDCSGAGLLEFHGQVMPRLDRQTIAAIGGNSATTYVITYPIWAAHPQIQDPRGSFFLLPMNRYNSDPILELSFANQAEMDINGVPTFAISAMSAELLIDRRDVLVANWPTVNWDLVELETNFPSSGRQSIELPIPGNFTGILLRSYTTAAARGDITSAGGQWQLQQSNVVFRQFTFPFVQVENDWSRSPGATDFAGSYYLDFLTDKAGQGAGELGSLLNGNIPVNSGTKILLVGDITGGAAVKLKQVYHRAYGDLKDLKLLAN